MQKDKLSSNSEETSEKKKRKKQNEEAIVAQSVAMLMEADRKYISKQWQKGETKKRKKDEVSTSTRPKQYAEIPKVENSLHHWKRPDELFSLFGITSFEDLQLDDQILKTISFKEPKRIQVCAVPCIRDGFDVLMGSGPSSGKTSAYIVSILHRLKVHVPRLSRKNGTQVVILCRDLKQCEEIFDILSPLLTKTCWWLTCSIFAGGDNRNHEKARLRKGVNLMITTESRLLDHLENTSSFKVDEMKYFIVEEAGDLLKLKRGGKLRRANQILQERVKLSHNPRIQNIICTSTYHPELDFLITCMLHDPVCIGFRLELGPTKKWKVHVEANWDILNINSVDS